jgi:hypothetical protein
MLGDDALVATRTQADTPAQRAPEAPSEPAVLVHMPQVAVSMGDGSDDPPPGAPEAPAETRADAPGEARGRASRSARGGTRPRGARLEHECPQEDARARGARGPGRRGQGRRGPGGAGDACRASRRLRRARARARAGARLARYRALSTLARAPAPARPSGVRVYRAPAACAGCSPPCLCCARSCTRTRSRRLSPSSCFRKTPKHSPWSRRRCKST